MHIPRRTAFPPGTITKLDLTEMLGRDFTEEGIDHMILDSVR